MSAGALASKIGKTATLQVDRNWSCTMTVLDARESFGRVDLLVQPVSGSGQVWVSEDRVTIQD